MLLSRETLIILIACVFSVNFVLLIYLIYRRLKSSSSCLLHTSHTATVQPTCGRNLSSVPTGPQQEKSSTCKVAIVSLPTEYGHCSPKIVTVQQRLGDVSKVMNDPPSCEAAVQQEGQHVNST